MNYESLGSNNEILEVDSDEENYEKNYEMFEIMEEETPKRK